jgi:S1-C subfamily serine protease
LKKKAEGGGGDDDNDDGAPGMLGTGTGFFVSPDGYIMTNRHVAEVGDIVMVRFSDGTEKPAERIVIDDEQDIAIIKVKVDEAVPFIRLADYDSPNIGADVTVLGFPLGSMLGQSVKITRGIVTAWEEDQDKCDVIVDAQVNPGNSGGPMVDKYGNLLALVAMKTISDQKVSSYGLGISNGRLRKFIEKHTGKFVCSFDPAPASGDPLSSEQIASRLRPAVVCIIMIRDASGASSGSAKPTTPESSPGEEPEAPSEDDANPPAAPKSGKGRE